MEEVWALLQNLGYFGVASAAIAWLVKSLFGHMMIKDVERFKADLNKSALEHKVTFEHLHEKRATILVDYYKEVCGVRSIIAAFRLSSDKDYSEHEKMLLKGAMIGVYNAEKILRDNEIFFSNGLRKRSKELNLKMLHYAGMTDASLTFAIDAASEATPERLSMLATGLKEGFQSVEDDITPLLEEIRAEFQNLLGIDNE